MVAAIFGDAQSAHRGVDKDDEDERKGDHQRDGRPVFKNDSFKHEE